jgi:hypothetical protein
VTVADIYLALVQLELQQIILESNFRNSMSNLNNHFKRIIELPEFKARMGNIKQGKKQISIPSTNEKIDTKISAKKEKSKQA